MDFYISILEKTLKVTDEFIIGRGSPFENLLTHFSISRAHAKIEVIEGHFFITDFGSDGGTKVNGEKISPHKRIKLNLDTDKIAISDIDVIVSLETESNDVDIIHHYKARSLKKPLFAYLVTVFFATYMFVLFKVDYSQRKESLYILSFLFLCTTLVYYIFRLIHMKSSSSIHSLYAGRNGFTLHFEKKSTNMSIKYEDIKAVELANDDSITIGAHNEIFRIESLGGLEPLKSQIKEKVSEEIISYNKKSVPNFYYFIALSLFIVGASLVKNQLSLEIYTLVGYGFILLALFYKIVTPKEKLIREGFANSKNIKRKKMALGIASGFLLINFGYHFGNYRMMNQTLTQLDQCMSGEDRSCQNIDSLNAISLIAGQDLRVNFLKRACQKGNTEACALLEK